MIGVMVRVSARLGLALGLVNMLRYAFSFFMHFHSFDMIANTETRYRLKYELRLLLKSLFFVTKCLSCFRFCDFNINVSIDLYYWLQMSSPFSH